MAATCVKTKARWFLLGVRNGSMNVIRRGGATVITAANPVTALATTADLMMFTVRIF